MTSPDEFELRAQRRRAERRQRASGAGAGGTAGDGGLRRIMAAAIGLACLTFLWALLQPFAGSGGERVRVEIAKNAGVSEIADLLADRGVIESATLFQIRATVAGKRGDLKPGLYRLRRASSYGAVIDKLVTGPPVKVIDIVVPEGLDRSRIAPIVARSGIKGDYLQASANTSLIPARRYGAQNAKNLEGFLFPATYELKPGATAEQFVRKQIQGFDLNLAGVNMSYARKKNLNVYDVVTIASMIEGEASLGRERPLVAAVAYNRLEQGIPLGIDATTRFETRNWTEPLTQSTLAADTPYNTRINAGLPPGPIGNPGLASLKAAARPAKAGYLYYVAKPGTCGEHAFSSTSAQFDADVARYNAAREAAGGKDPQECP
ncbi:MAG: endolytic transglycosylase MltG [Solirubrobacterales bacterium]